MFKSFWALYESRKKSFKNDSEPAQAFLRVIALLCLVPYYIYLYRSGFDGIVTAVAAFVILGGAFGIFAHILVTGRPSVPRRYLGAVWDNASATFFMFMMGPSGALALFAYPFVTVGNGFRFGIKNLAFSGALGLVGFGAVILFESSWDGYETFGVGVLLSNLCVIAYTGVLLRSLHRTKEQLEQMATSDALTGLPNRRLLLDRISSDLIRTRRAKRAVACLYFDLDGFKKVNDVHGHKAGDLLLKEVAKRVSAEIRAVDTLARLGGDEFVISCEITGPPEEAQIIAKRVIDTIEGIKEVEGKSVKVSASVGVCYVAGDLAAPNPEELVKIADEAMYRAKKAGKGRFDSVSLAGSPVLAVA